MKAGTAQRLLLIAVAILSTSLLAGCAGVLGVSKSSPARDGRYYPCCLVKADQALDEARMAGKDKDCPDEFNAIKEMVDNAYKVHLACNTEGACKMAREAANRVKALTCAPKAVPPPPPAPAPVTPPTCDLKVNPASITSGNSAALSWTSANATDCTIQPGIGPVKTEGSTTITPTADTAYTLTCNGPGGTASSAANITVVVPPPPAPAPPAEMLCYKIDIEFDTAKWNIKPQYHDELVKLATFMKDYPDLKGVVEGHTDNRGGKAYNQTLSEKRAKSVRDYLVTKLGIDGKRLTAKGYGLTKPIADNKTAEGRQLNRRVVANFGCVEKKAKKKR